MTNQPLVIAHRGASGYRPEHTRAAYELGIALGADAIEPDLVVTRDGILVVRHESEISGTTDVSAKPEFANRRTTKIIDGVSHTGWFTEDFTWAELCTLRARERLPRLRQLSSTFDDRLPILRLTDVLQIVDDAEREVLLVAELKHATYFESLGFSLDELLAAEVSHWAHRDKLVVESFEKSVLDRLRLRDFAARLTFLIEDQGAPADLVAQFGSDAMTYADLLSDRELARMTSSVDAISVNTSLLAGGALVERAHTVGLEVYAWTLRAENEFLEAGARIGAVPSDFGDWMGAFLRILSTGVDGVFADQPDLAIEAREVMRSAQ